MPQPRRGRERPRRVERPRYEQPPTGLARPSRAAQIQRRRLIGAAALCAAGIAVVVIILSLGGSSDHKPKTTAQTSRAAASTPAHHRNGQKAAPQDHPSSPSPGTLPQTHALPSGTTAQFKSQMAALWAGVVHNSTSRALPAFFPRAAYLKVKAPHAGPDYKYRIVHAFTLDIGAAHALLGAGASSARLVSVHVPQGFAHWVDAGACDNQIGYYEVPNARVVYKENGQVHSFGIASMISWRGVWYVIHLGVVVPSGIPSSGTVDSPSVGPGTSVDSGSC